METIYSQMAERTDGNVYIGVVGPVRTGKSTLIKALMHTLVIPGICDPNTAQRATDELPQSSSGRTIMTSEPKFIPEEAVQICPDGKTKLRVRLIDSVGYMIPGAVGAEEDGEPRMISTPWFDHPIAMAEAAQLGTQKVIREHATVGIVVTTDGTITDIPRQDYLQAEEAAILDMQATGKPFLVVVNTRYPGSESSGAVQDHLREKYSVESIAADCQALDERGLSQLFQQLLLCFPLRRLCIHMPRWVDALENEHPVKAAVYHALLESAENITVLAQAESALKPVQTLEDVQQLHIQNVDLGTGTVSVSLSLPEALFYQILSQRCGEQITDQSKLIALLTELSEAKKAYSKVSQALSAANATGYGIVMPLAEDIQLQAPELAAKGGSYGVKLKANASSIHMLRVDVDAQLTPTVGTRQQAQELVDFLNTEATETLWESNLFGKSVGSMISDGLNEKLLSMPEDVRNKFRGSLCRVVNEGANGLICLIL